MQIATVDDQQVWDSALLALPNPHILQSWAWGEFKSRHGWRATRLLFSEGEEAVAAASVLRRTVPRLPVSILYVPKGPALDWTRAGLAERVLQELSALARRERALFVKVDPDVYYSEEVPCFSPRPAQAAGIARMLASRGWRYSSDQIQFRNTLLLDLRRTEDELLGCMKQKTRYNVRLASRRGVTVRSIGADDSVTEREAAFSIFYKLYAETGRRDGFVIRPPEYYRDAWGSFIEGRSARLFLAEHAGEPLAGLLLFYFGPTAWYMYGASSERERQRMPNYLLQWEAIRWAKAQGCTLYDLWGAPDEFDESDPMWGVVRFKLGLGGELARGLGAWDLPVSRFGYWLYTSVMPRYLNWLRSHNQTGE
ncbi:MAG: lipid II:glycine glycyltransferase FemX [Anaerolineae bacterium]|jgi:lipid II:glycine glycyltransferase (peptidoglycan interpeptide bridge formation enzyme)